MRIVLVSREYPPETAHGGIGSQTYLKAHGLAALGHHVQVLSRSSGGKASDAKDGPVRVRRILGAEARLPATTEPVEWLTYSTEVAVAIAALHARARLDLVDVPEWGCEGYVHLLNRTEANRVPTVVQLYGPLVMFAHTIGAPEPDSEWYRVGTAMEGACVRLADAVYSSSACCAQWAAKHYGLQASEIRLLHAGIDTRLFSPGDVPKHGRPTIICIGDIVRNKGMDTLVEAACRTAREVPALCLRMVGRGQAPAIHALRAKAESMGLAGLLEFPGEVERRALPTELSQAHLFVAPSAYEAGHGCGHLEAMACGLPVVACEGGPAAEALVAGQNGVLVPPGNVEALANGLRLLLAYPKRRDAMAQGARRYAEEHADTVQCVKRIDAFYRQVVGGQGGNRGHAPRSAATPTRHVPSGS